MAFTLAEVLITLGIIGIVAAMTMPVLVANYQKQQTVSQLKKAYSTFSQALVKSQYDNGDSSEWKVLERGSFYEENLEYFETYWKPYLKIIKMCKTMKECGYNITGYSNLTDKNYNAYGLYHTVPGFIYGDGTFAYIRPFSINDTMSELQLLTIDLNGVKGPNCLGKDVFQYMIDINKGVIKGFGNPAECVKDRIMKSPENSRTCAAKILKDGWQIKDDYPW